MISERMQELAGVSLQESTYKEYDKAMKDSNLGVKKVGGIPYTTLKGHNDMVTKHVDLKWAHTTLKAALNNPDKFKKELDAIYGSLYKMGDPEFKPTNPRTPETIQAGIDRLEKLKINPSLFWDD